MCTTARTCTRRYFQYNKNPNEQRYLLLNGSTGKKELLKTVTVAPVGGAPQVSHDGKLLAFVKRVRTRSVLYLHNIETAEEWAVYDKLSKGPTGSLDDLWHIHGVCMDA